MSSQHSLQQILAEYREGLREVIGKDLDTIFLYGSCARGEATDESDIDVLCIIRKPFDYGKMILKTGEVSAAISLNYDVVISTVFVTRADYETRQTPFLMNVRREAGPV